MKIEFTPSLKTVNNESIIGTGNISTGGGDGTVTNVATSAPLSGGPITTTGTISITKASSTTDGYLSSTDWATFNSKQPAGAYLTTVTADSPLNGSGTSASHLTIPAASGSVNGYLTSTDWSTFNNKADASSLGNYVLKAGDTMSGKLTLATTSSSLVPIHFPQGSSTPSAPTNGDMWFDTNGMYIQNLSAIHQLDADANAVGALSKVAITDNGNGTINASTVDVFIYAQSGWQGDYARRTVPVASNLSLVSGVNYLTVTYNSGSPIFQITQNSASVNNSNVLLIANMWLDGTQIHYTVVNWGLATATRLNDRLINVQRYVRTSGLTLGETATPVARTITASSGVVWYGVTAVSELAVDSSSSNCDFYYHVAGVWTKSSVSTYNNSQYDNGTNLVTLSGGGTQYAVNWVYRYIDGSSLPKLAYVLGSGNYSLAQAQASTAPTLPSILTAQAILIGRIIVAQNASTATQIDSAFTTVFAGSTVTDHNNLAGLQGGTTAEYYHLTSAQYTVSTQAATGSVNGYLTSTDWTTFNSKQPAGSYLTTVTSDSPLTGSGTSGSHLSIPVATGSVNGYLSSTDWTTFNSKQPAGSYITGVVVDAPLSGAGTSASHLSMAAATSSANGYLTSTDWTTFNSKQGLTTISTKTADFTVNAENWYINNKSGSTCTVTMPTASTNTGRAITFKNLQAQTLVSASSNIVPIDSTTAGTAILANVVGNWATLVSDGTNWIIMQQAPNNILLLE